MKSLFSKINFADRHQRPGRTRGNELFKKIHPNPVTVFFLEILDDLKVKEKL